MTEESHLFSGPTDTEDAEWLGYPPGEPIIGRTYRADGWVPRDLGWITEEWYSKLMNILGEDNYLFLAQTHRTSAKDGLLRRGQMLISPTGMTRLREYVASLPPTKQETDTGVIQTH